MSLHVDSHEYAGAGRSAETLLLIHGWGMHGGLWGNIAERLAQHVRVLAVDLPGHGYSTARIEDRGLRIEEKEPPCTLDSIVDQLSIQFSEPLVVCGWSLGGQVALRWATRQPQRVRRLILVASTPCFVQRADWPCAMAAHTLSEFDAALRKDYVQTLRRFLALQVRSGEQERDLLAHLRSMLFSRGAPDLGALQGGLDILRDFDLRGELSCIEQAALVIGGERDTLVPPAAVRFLADKLPNARLVNIQGAAHAPFLSHPNEFLENVVDFLNE